MYSLIEGRQLPTQKSCKCVFSYLLLTGSFNLSHNVAKFGHNSPRLSLCSFEILFINFLCLNFHLQQKCWYHSTLEKQRRLHTLCTNDTVLTFCFIASIFERRRFPRLPVHPAANSGPREVSAVKECLVPRFDSKMNPGRSSRKIVACYRKKKKKSMNQECYYSQAIKNKIKHYTFKIFIKPSFMNTKSWCPVEDRR